MKNVSFQTIIYSALFAALAFISTSFFRVQIVFGYMHLADIFLFFLLTTFFRYNLFFPLGVYALFMSISDIYLGYPNYSITTFVSRFLIIIVYSSCKKEEMSLWLVIHSIVWFIIPINYFLTDLVLFGLSNAIFFISFNIIQVLFPILMQFSISIKHLLHLRKFQFMKNIHNLR